MTTDHTLLQQALPMLRQLANDDGQYDNAPLFNLIAAISARLAEPDDTEAAVQRSRTASLPPLPPIPVGALTDGEAAMLRQWAYHHAIAALRAAGVEVNHPSPSA